jgi:hypothetical protein
MIGVGESREQRESHRSSPSFRLQITSISGLGPYGCQMIFLAAKPASAACQPPAFANQDRRLSLPALDRPPRGQATALLATWMGGAGRQTNHWGRPIERNGVVDQVPERRLRNRASQKRIPFTCPCGQSSPCGQGFRPSVVRRSMQRSQPLLSVSPRTGVSALPTKPPLYVIRIGGCGPSVRDRSNAGFAITFSCSSCCHSLTTSGKLLKHRTPSACQGCVSSRMGNDFQANPSWFSSEPATKPISSFTVRSVPCSKIESLQAMTHSIRQDRPTI